ncbi:MAG: enoyl-CoA hydratase-related protein, partial [Halioglobus sp.]
GYPAVRFGTPDMQFHPWLVGMRKGMEMLLTGDSLSGVECAARGWATASFPQEELEQRVLDIATRIALLPPDIVQLNKRAVHRQMEVMGLRQGIRAGTELCALGVHQVSFKRFIGEIESKGLTTALQQRDEKFGDYRTGHSKDEG